MHDKTMLHRVVMKRSGRRAVAEDASGFTAADHLICARLLGKLGIFRPLLEYCALRQDRILRWRRCRPQKPGCRSDVGYRDKKRLWKLAQGFWDRIPCAIKFPVTAPSRQSSQCPGPIVPSLYSVRVSVRALVWLW